MTARRVLACGGRRYADYVKVCRELDALLTSGMKVLITGGATGADELASRWAKDRAIPQIIMPAAWDRLGPKAGPARNRWMLEYAVPDLVVAFPGGRGTDHMLLIARGAGIEAREVG